MNDTDETSSTVHGSNPPPRIRIAYGTAPEQFGVLHLPGGDDAGADDPADDLAPVVILVHGGFWRNPYDLTLMDPLAADLVGRGFAVWNIEYRRVGDDRGGWPGTFTDVAAAVDDLAVIAADHAIDVTRVAVVGHSAGGHLALWAAGRAGLPEVAPGAAPVVIPNVAVGLGAVVDLMGAARGSLGNGAVPELLGGTPDEVPDRYAAARPGLIAGPGLVSVVGTHDDVVPPQYSIDPDRPDAIRVVEIEGADHFDLIDPLHAAWSAAIEALDDIAPEHPRTRLG